MTVGKLKQILNNYDDEEIIVFEPSNSNYGEYIESVIEGKGICSFHKGDYRALIMTSGGQCGSICRESELDLDEDD